MANHVFITHAVEDKKIANLVCEALESNGIKCWIAPRDVPYGMTSRKRSSMQFAQAV